MRSRTPWRALLAASAVAALVACGTSTAAVSVSPDEDGLHGTDVTGAIARPVLALPDTAGSTFDLRRRPAGQLTVVYFGYTRCPDLCPTTMADLAAARRHMTAADRSHTEVAFVTEDPGTDSAPVLRRYLDGFDPSFVGLTGGDPAAEQALDALKSPRTEVLPSAPPGVQAPASGPVVQHTNTVYAFRGDRVVAYTERTSPADYAEDFHALLGD